MLWRPTIAQAHVARAPPPADSALGGQKLDILYGRSASVRRKGRVPAPFQVEVTRQLSKLPQALVGLLSGRE